MKTKQNLKAHGVFMLWVKKYFKYQVVLTLFLIVFFIFSKNIQGAEKKVIINEIQISGGSKKTTEDFIEIYNNSNSAVDIAGWKLRKKNSSGGADVSIKVFGDKSVIPAKGYFLWSNSSIKEILKSDESSLATISSNNSIALFDNKNNIIDQVGWGESSGTPFVEVIAVDVSKFVKDMPEIIQRKKFQDSDNNSEDFEIREISSPEASGCLEYPEKCKIEEEKEDVIEEPKIYPTGINITELFPNPFQSQYEEYVELYNGTNEDVDLMGWELHDASKSGKYVFPESIILKAQKYLAIFKSDFKFALNNSGDESVTLFDPNGKEITKALYDGSKRNASYNFDGLRWRWSKFLTPGKENILNSEPYGKTKIEEDIFEKVYADFSISTGDLDGDNVKVTWDFGDGHKSYLARTRHKYEKIGEYQASVKLSDGSEDVVQDFEIKVKKFPRPKVRIVTVKANPAGKDSEFETITIENRSKKKISLEGWSIATGSKNLVNHPIAEEVVLKKKEIKEITREISKFSLNNKEGKIELRYPDGKVAQKIKYTKKVGIKEDEEYVKTKSGWRWTSQNSNEKSEAGGDIEEMEDNEKIGNNIEEDLGGEVAGVEIVKKEIAIFRKKDLKNIKMSGTQTRVLGIETIKEINGQYLFAYQNKETDHYAVVFLRNVSLDINSNLNDLLNYLFK